MSEIHLLSDSHFFHERIIQYCHRPFKDENEMNDEMEKRWGIFVEPDDIMIYVGDLTASLKGRRADLKALIGRLPGKKILVKGNHDHEKNEFYIEAGFTSVVDYIATSELLFVHVPDVSDENSKAHPWAHVTKLLREKHNPKLIIHGHDHRTGTLEYEGHFNCAADRHNYMPFTLTHALQRVGLEKIAEQAKKDILTWIEEQEAIKNAQNTPH